MWRSIASLKQRLSEEVSSTELRAEDTEFWKQLQHAQAMTIKENEIMNWRNVWWTIIFIREELSRS
jgi:hypothetical protein